jgi:hypothetical protein
MNIVRLIASNDEDKALRKFLLPVLIVAVLSLSTENKFRIVIHRKAC